VVDRYPYPDLVDVAMAPAERFLDRQLYETTVLRVLTRSASGPDWKGHRLKLSHARLEGVFPDTGLYVGIASARTHKELVRKGFYVWRDVGAEEQHGDVSPRTARGR
jgi:hypothetical protein